MTHRNGNHRHCPDRATFEERLAAGRAMVAAIRAAGPAALPVHHADQLAAAAHDAHHLTHTLGDAAVVLEPDRQWRSTHVAADAAAADEISARIYAAVSGCALCRHLRGGGPQPAWARLPLHRLDCCRCAATVYRRPAGEDDVCDWCHRPGVAVFTTTALQMGPLIAVGDACGDCAAVLREVAA